MSKILSKEQVEEQRLCYAVKACHLMGFDVEKNSRPVGGGYCASENALHLYRKRYDRF